MRREPVGQRSELVGQRSETVRRANLSSIVHELHLEGPASRSELVARTGLTRSAIRELTGELLDAGLVREERGALLGHPGRPSPVVRPEPRGLMALALEIAVDSLAAALVGFGGEVLARTRVDRGRASLSVPATVDQLATLARPMLASIADRSRLAGVGVAIVGIVRREDGLVTSAPNLDWHDVPLAAVLADALGLDVPIVVANEADLGGLAELRRGAARREEDVIFVSGEVGVGGGVITGGRPLTGAAGFAGEIGHVIVNPAGVTCRCGSVGCWETEIGERAILARAGLPSDGGRQAVDGLLDDASHGDSAALAALDATGEWLGTGLAGLVNVFDPRVVVLGGVFGRMLPHVGPTIERRLERHALAASRALVRIVPAELGIDAPLIGAAELAFDPVLADPAARLGPRVERRTSRPAITRSPTRVAESSAKGVRAGRRRGTMRRDNPDRWIGPPATRRMVRLAGGEGGWT